MIIDIIKYSSFVCASIFIAALLNLISDDKLSTFFSIIVLVLNILMGILFIFVKV